MKTGKDTIDLNLASETQEDLASSGSEHPWFIVREGFKPNLERITETALALGNGFIGARNILEEGYDLSEPAFFVAGVYREVDEFHNEELAKLPNWSKIQVFIDNNEINLFDNETLEHKRYLDLKKGLAIREWTTSDEMGRITQIKIIKFISLSFKNEAYKSIVIKADNYSGNIKVIAGIDGNESDSDIFIPQGDKATIIMKTKTDGNTVVLNQNSRCQENKVSYKKSQHRKSVNETWEWIAEMDQEYRIESIITIFSGREIKDPEVQIENYIKKIHDDYFARSITSHIRAWKKKWSNSGITIVEDKIAQKWINFALYHLASAGEFSGIYHSVGARALTGFSYQGHIFWETEIYLLPYYLLTTPEIARNLLIYRFKTLDGARENAKLEGHKGSCFAWESTASGIEKGPLKVISPYNEIIPIYSSSHEIHVTPDITYAIWQYWQATHDEEFLLKYGSEIVFEAARFCAGFFKKGKDGCYHIHDVVGPDEYHERIDDNAYTNLMARHNLVIAIKLALLLEKQYQESFTELKTKINLQEQELENWKKIKDNVYTGFQPDTHLFEQFKGYFDLEYIDLKAYEPRNMSMDVLLGREKIKKSQVIKQADVLMFLFLLANNYSLETVRCNYDYYEPRTGHGSSLSPSIHSIVASRLGIADKAFKYFEQNATIDLNDNMGNATGGIHIGSNGGTWMSVVMGFAGMYIHDNGLLFDPHIPEKWDEIKFPLQWRKQSLLVTVKNREIKFEITGDGWVEISIGYNNWKKCKAGQTYVAQHKNEKWQWKN